MGIKLKNFVNSDATNVTIAAAASIAVLAFGFLIASSHASGFFVSVSPAQGTVATNAKVVTDASALGGQTIQFTAPAAGSGTGGGTGGGGGSGGGATTTTGCVNGANAAPCIGNATTGASGWGTPVFDDEFNGTSLDTAKWASSWFNKGSMNNVTTDPANVAVSGGNLVLTLASSGSGALVSTNPKGGASAGYQFTTGYYTEARIYFPGSGSTIYNWPAFWADGQTWPADGEIDIAEGLGQLTSNYHSPSGANNGSGQGSGWAAGFHTYGVDRENGKNTIYWDGKQIRTYITNDSGAPEYLILNVGSSGTTVTGSASQVKVDYVRVWK